MHVDIRHLYGTNRFLDGPSILVIAEPDAEVTPEAIAAALEAALREAAGMLGWGMPPFKTLVKPRSVFFCFGARSLDVGWELGRSATLAARAALEGRRYVWDDALARLERAIEHEKPPALLAGLLEEAARRDVPITRLEDEELLVGHGARGLRISRREPPPEVAWERLGRIPIVAITGTNGKTTVTRLLARVFAEMGRTVGSTSSDGVKIGDTWLEEGDCTGPASMLEVFKDPRVEVAILEAARGGILRRGLPFDRCDIGLVTNIVPDHLGLDGVDSLDEMAEVKGTVVRALAPAGTAVLSADDARVAALRRADRRALYFARSMGSPVLTEHLAHGGSAVVVDGDRLRVLDPQSIGPSLRLDEIPITLGGAARHNAENAAAALAACVALRLPWEPVRRALTGFAPSPEDNPGRLNPFSFRGAMVLLDFAHNVDGIRALVETAAQMPARRRILLIGQAGDRTDNLIRQEAASAWAARPDVIVIKETPEQLRGRKPLEVPRLFHDAFLALGAPEVSICHEDTELDGVKRALAEAEPGDLVLLMIHLVRKEAFEILRAG